jgi:outer membrane protein OmpA-like peptidoglycan-associated protein
MIKRLSLTGLVIMIANPFLFAQESAAPVDTAKTYPMPTRADYNTWSAGVNGGVTIFHGDVSGKDPVMGFGLGLTVGKALSHTFGLYGSFFYGALKGDSKDYSYSGGVISGTFGATASTGNISFLKNKGKMNFYAYAGGGMMQFTPEVKTKATSTTSKAYNPTTEPGGVAGGGVRFRTGKSLAVTLEYALHIPNSDKADGMKTGSSRDMFSYINAGVTYTFGRKEKNIEWVNPLETVYDDLGNLKKKVDGLSGDRDGDGVADIFDKDQSTGAGIKVYGDGTAVDTDGDGVPDSQDTDPFSAKGAKVDANGKETDTDEDGVPDSRDLEAATPKGTLVNFQGITIPKLTDSLMQSMSSSVEGAYFPSIFFGVNNANVDSRYYESLASVAKTLKSNPNIKLTLIGNCDASGGDAENIKLGERRANAVKAHLEKYYGIDPSRLTVESKGEAEPLANKLNSINRRVDFKVTK